MRKLFSFTILIVVWGGLSAQLRCDQSLWPHVYHPELLQGEKKCTTVKGIVKGVKAEEDGSYSVQLKLDPGQPTILLNEKNLTAQNGCLVVVIICAHRPIASAEAAKSCGAYENSVKVPVIGDHVQVTGTYVLDSDPAHGWNALQPVSDLIELQRR